MSSVEPWSQSRGDEIDGEWRCKCTCLVINDMPMTTYIAFMCVLINVRNIPRTQETHETTQRRYVEYGMRVPRVGPFRVRWKLIVV